MRFGFGGISCQRYPGDPRTDVELYEQAVALAEAAEECGYDSVWVAEHHFSDDAFLPSLLPLCAAFAARTRRITIGTAVVLAPLHEPIRLAEDAAVVDLLSHGRLILGLGQGYIPTEFDAFRVDPATRHLRLEDTVATLRQAWSGDLVVGGEEDGWALVRDSVHYMNWKYSDLAVSRDRRGGPRPAPTATSSELAGLREAIVYGTPARVAEHVKRLAEAAGGEFEMIARLYWPGMPFDVQRRALEVFAAEVIGRVR